MPPPIGYRFYDELNSINSSITSKHSFGVLNDRKIVPRSYTITSASSHSAYNLKLTKKNTYQSHVKI